MPTSYFIRKNIERYKKLKPCYCPVLQEMVYFNSTGLNHLLYHRRRPRSHNEKHYRAGLIPHLTDVIKNSVNSVKKIESEKPLIVTWELKHQCKVNRRNQIVKVILIKRGSGKVNFLSAMSKVKRKRKLKKS